jgi:hypothetical protein
MVACKLVAALRHIAFVSQAPHQFAAGTPDAAHAQPVPGGIPEKP